MLFVFLRCLSMYILSRDVIPLTWYMGEAPGILFFKFFLGEKRGEIRDLGTSQVPTRLTCFSGANHGVKIGGIILDEPL